jgi:uncharacterized protein
MTDGTTGGCGDLFLVVARAPLPGFTKTRLGNAIGMECAAQLYLAFLRDVAASFFAPASLPNGVTRGWAYTPESFDFEALLSTFPNQMDTAGSLFVPQQGESLGERLTNLLRWATDRGFERTVIMASDSPQLDASIAIDALAALHNSDLVIGRTLDGGYYLVGARGYSDILSRVPMSTADAAQALVELAATEGRSVAELRPDFDVDTGSDLALLVELLQTEPRLAPATCAALKQLGLL